MKERRHNKILEIISERVVETQEELAGLLQAAGFRVTQATVSRDIRELRLMKVPTDDGRQKYGLMQGEAGKPEGRSSRILKDAIISIDSALNLLVIKTNAGMAMAVAATIDAMHLPEMVGTLAGDDTVFCAIRTIESTEVCKKQLEECLR